MFFVVIAILPQDSAIMLCLSSLCIVEKVGQDASAERLLLEPTFPKIHHQFTLSKKEHVGINQSTKKFYFF